MKIYNYNRDRAFIEVSEGNKIDNLYLSDFVIIDKLNIKSFWLKVIKFILKFSAKNRSGMNGSIININSVE